MNTKKKKGTKDEQMKLEKIERRNLQSIPTENSNLVQKWNRKKKTQE